MLDIVSFLSPPPLPLGFCSVIEELARVWTVIQYRSRGKMNVFLLFTKDEDGRVVRDNNQKADRQPDRRKGRI